MGKIKDLTGQVFGRLKVIGFAGVIKHQSYWHCECSCGKSCIVRGVSLTNGNTRSCGCLHKETFTTTTHGQRHKQIYRIWCAMKTRCLNPNCPRYQNYGGRGITICERWANSFENFYADVSKLPHFGEEGYSLDRIDNNGNYCPENCRWATASEQNRNQRTNIFVEYQMQKMCLNDAAKLCGIDRRTLARRFKAGDRGERLFRPVRK